MRVSRSPWGGLPSLIKVVLEFLGEIFDVVRWPLIHIHTKVKSHCEHFLISFKDLRPKLGVRNISASVF